MKRIYLSCLVFLFLYSVTSAQVAELYVVNPTKFEVLNGSKIPSDKAVLTKLSAQVCSGEYEPLSFLINPKQSISNITLEWTDFKGTAGTIVKTALDPYIAKIWWQAGINTIYSAKDPSDSLVQELLIKNDNLLRVNWTTRKNELLVKNKNTGANSYITISDPKISFPTDVEIYDAKTLQPFNMTDGKNKQLYLIFRAPNDAKAGTYTSQMTVKAGTTVIKTFPIEIKILPFKLSEPDFLYSIYYTAGVTTSLDAKSSFSGLLKDTTQYRIEMQDILAHGIKYPQNNNGYGSQSLTMGIRNKVGLPNDKIFVHAIGVSFSRYGDGEMTLSELMTTVNNYKSTFNNLGYPTSSLYFYGYDEANTSTYGLPAGTKSSLERVVPAYKEARAKAGIKIYQAVSSYGSNYTVGGPYIDLPIMFANRSSTYYDYSDILNEVTKYRADGKHVLGYNNPQMGAENPEIYRRNHGFLAWKDNFTGIMDWKYQSTQGHIWNDWDHDYRDPNCTYPITKGVISTIQWEAVREAVDDMRYLATLQNLIKGLSGTQKTSAESFVANLKSSLSQFSKPEVVRASIIDYILKLTGNPATPSDVVAPQISSVRGVDPVTLELKFSEEVDAVTAQTASNYTISGISVTSSVLGTDKKTVKLKTSRHKANVAYTVVVKNVKDLAGNIIAASSSKSYSFQKSPVRINVGGSAITAGGNAFIEDQYFTLGHINTYTAPNGIAGTDNDAIYLTERWEHEGEEMVYKIPVFDSPYKIVLHFSENYQTAAGKRIFNVLVEDVPKISSLDIYAKVGGFTAYTYECEIPQPTDGFIDLKFTALNSGGSKVSAIEVIPIDNITDLSWNVNLTVAQTGGSKILTFGQSASATIGLDGSLGESILPPMPPETGSFDARFIFPDNSTASLKDFRTLTDSVVTWNLKLSGTPPYILSWDPAKLPSSDVYLVDKINGSLVRVDMKAASSTTISLNLDGLYIKMAVKDHVVNFDLNKGWNIVSMPVKMDDMNADNIFADIKSSDVFAYDNGYVAADIMEVGRGYWVNMNSEKTFDAAGEKSSNSVNVKQGWNLIGFSDCISLAQVSSEPANIVTSDLFGFNNGYILADSLICGKGYWVKVNQEGKLVFQNSAAKTSIFKQGTIDENWGVISISDADNNSTNLYLAENMQIGEEYELPPAPPAGIFDARFAGDKLIAHAGEPSDVLLRGMTYPIKIKVNGINVNLSDKFGGQVLNSTLTSGQEIIVSSPLEVLQISGEMIPLSYELKQNYPNPFNPTTHIAFSLPKPGNVKITVYNTLGEQVTELLNEQLEAGSHNIEFNAHGMASGVYFYRLETSSFTNVKKMMLLK